MVRRTPVSAAAAAAAAAAALFSVSAAILTGPLVMPEAAVQRGASQIIADLNVFSNPEWQRACDTLGAWKAETDEALTERVCCAWCGASDFKHVNIKCGDGTHEHIGNNNFKEVAPPSPTAIPPYLLQSEVCEGQCVTPGGQWIACKICRGKKAGQRAKLQPAVSTR